MATRTRKVLIGCGAGCLGLVVLWIGACVGFGIWIRQPGELLEPTRLLGRDTTGYVEWTLRVEDPGSEAFVESLMELQERVQERNPSRAPAWLNQILENRRQRNKAQAVRQLMPTVVAWTIRPGETPDTDLHLFTVSMKSLGNRSRFLDLTLRYTVGLRHSVVHADERIYSNDDGAMFIRDNSFFFTNSLANARLAVDRLRGEGDVPEAEAVGLPARVAALPDTPLRGTISNARGELARIWRQLSHPDADRARDADRIWGAIRGATISGGFAGQTAFECTVDFQGPDEAWAAANAEPLVELLRADLGLGHMPADLQATAAGDSVRVTLHIDDVFGFLDEL